jgi:hypothetical protein
MDDRWRAGGAPNPWQPESPVFNPDLIIATMPKSIKVTLPPSALYPQSASAKASDICRQIALAYTVKLVFDQIDVHRDLRAIETNTLPKEDRCLIVFWLLRERATISNGSNWRLCDVWTCMDRKDY